MEPERDQEAAVGVGIGALFVGAGRGQEPQTAVGGGLHVAVAVLEDG